MSVVIVGGNERMERRYKDLCEDFQCRAKVFTKPRGGLRDKVGSPDLMIFFTDTMSHKMLLGALSELWHSSAPTAGVTGNGCATGKMTAGPPVSDSPVRA